VTTLRRPPALLLVAVLPAVGAQLPAAAPASGGALSVSLALSVSVSLAVAVAVAEYDLGDTAFTNPRREQHHRRTACGGALSAAPDRPARTCSRATAATTT
jgi:hypothetical protein